MRYLSSGDAGGPRPGKGVPTKRIKVDPPKLKDRLHLLREGGREVWLVGTVKGLLSEGDLVRKGIARTRPEVVALTCNPAEARTLRTLHRERPEGYDLRESGDVQALAAKMWSWDCECGRSNPPGEAECGKCGKSAPGAVKDNVTGRAMEGGRTGHAAVDNLWAETKPFRKKAEETKDQKYTIGDVLTHHDEIYLALLLAFGDVRFPSPAFMAAVGEAKGKVVGIDMGEEAFSDLHVSEVGYMDLMRSSRMVRRIEKKGIRAGSPEGYVFEWDRQLMRMGGYARVEIARAKYMARKTRALAQKKGRVLLVCELERVEVLSEALKSLGFRRERA